MSIITRFAPSPTGFLHIGNIRIALLNYLYTKSKEGDFLLRFDDTDVSRSLDRYKESIKHDLNWLEIEYNQIIHQSQRLSRYEEIKNRLIKEEKVYACYETQEELEFQKKLALQQSNKYIYNAAKALSLTKAQIEKYEKEGRTPYYRFRLENCKTTWNDLIKTSSNFNEISFSDPVIFRNNGVPMYSFCSVVDDIDYNISHIIRGEDHVSNTAVQMQMFFAIDPNYKPIFAHVPLLKLKDGVLSKRIGSNNIADLLNNGILNCSIVNYLASIGSSKAIELFTDITKIIENFNIKSYSSSSIIYNEQDLYNINQKMIPKLTLSEIKDQLSNIFSEDSFSKLTQEIWNVIKENIITLIDIKTWYNIITSDKIKDYDQDLSEEDKNYLDIAHGFIPDKWEADSWDIFITKLKETTHRKGRELFSPLRLAITGKSSGPELKKLIPIIGVYQLKLRLKI